MKEKDQELVRELIREELKTHWQFNRLELFDCPECKRETIALRKYSDSLECPGIGGMFRLPPFRFWADRQCLICGNLFEQKPNVYEKVVEDEDQA